MKQYFFGVVRFTNKIYIRKILLQNMIWKQK